MLSFNYNSATKEYVRSDGKKTYPVQQELGRGSYGAVYRTSQNRILKVISGTTSHAFKQEVSIQIHLAKKEPGVCPVIYDYGIISQTNKYLVVMEQYDGTVHSLIQTDKTILLDFLKQIATIMQRLEKYQFNHRDLKRDNTMYRSQPRKYVLIDFGFACATFDGIQYAGTSYFSPMAKCFRRSRDLAQLIYETERYTQGFSQDDRTFLRLLLTFQLDGKKCEMFKGCPPDKISTWADTYKFLDRDNVENPHTTPEGLLHAIEVYQTRGIEACKDGFVVDPVADKCVARPSVEVIVPKDKPVTPRVSVVKPLLKPCPPGKVRNPETRRCRKEVRAKTKRAIPPTLKACPPDKIINPATNRCVKRDGAIGKKLIKG